MNMKIVSINGKSFKELTLRQKILTVIALPVILISAFVILFAVLGAAFIGITGLLAIILLPGPPPDIQLTYSPLDSYVCLTLA